MNERLALAIAAYHDGTLDDDGAALLVEALRGADAAAVHEQIAFDGLLGQVFTSDEVVVRSIRERLDAERSASAVVRAVRGSLTNTTRSARHSRRVAWLPRLAVAALLLVLIAGGWWMSLRGQARPGECRLEGAASVSLMRGGVAVPAPAGTRLLGGDHLTATDTATLVWADGSRLVLEPGTRVRLERPTLDPGLILEHGTLLAEIAPQRPGMSFAVATPEARVEVVGTRFHLTTAVQRTHVELHAGQVQVKRLTDARVLTLRPGDSVTVAAGEEFAVRSAATAVPPAATPPVTPTAVEPAWKPLFPPDGLDGWVAQHGRWSNLNGIIRGEDPRNGKARLIGRHPVADVEVTCRLRISGAAFAEVQVGDYNWFVEVPAQGAEWVQVEVRQRGDDLRISADGVVLPLHAGDGKPPRAGPLAFYVMPGGVLEISDARFRMPTDHSPVTR